MKINERYGFIIGHSIDTYEVDYKGRLSERGFDLIDNEFHTKIIGYSYEGHKIFVFSPIKELWVLADGAKLTFTVP